MTFRLDALIEGYIGYKQDVARLAPGTIRDIRCSLVRVVRTMQRLRPASAQSDSGWFQTRKARLLQAIARVTSAACSCLWMLADPEAGLGAAGRVIPLNGHSPKRREPKRKLMYGHAPMFSGSSCTHTTGVPNANGLSASRRSWSDNG